MRFEMSKAAAQMKEADAAIAAQKAELDKLNQIITEADQVTHPSHHFPQPSLADNCPCFTKSVTQASDSASIQQRFLHLTQGLCTLFAA